MAGNVSEWVVDRYAAYPGGVADTGSDYFGSTNVRRGGSWYSLGNHLRVSYRDKDLSYLKIQPIFMRCMAKLAFAVFSMCLKI